MGINFRRTINHKILSDKMSAIDEYGELKKTRRNRTGIKRRNGKRNGKNN